MRAERIVIKQSILAQDGLGGKVEQFKELELFGKLFFKKGVPVITRAYTVLTQKISNMYVLYVNTNYNKFEDLISIKKGDKLEIEYGNFRVNEIEAHNKNFVITFIEEDCYVNSNTEG